MAAGKDDDQHLRRMVADVIHLQEMFDRLVELNTTQFALRFTSFDGDQAGLAAACRERSPARH
jgi:hypothetical protein